MAGVEVLDKLTFPAFAVAFLPFRHIVGELHPAVFQRDEHGERRGNDLREQLVADGVGQVAEQLDALGEGGHAAHLLVRLVPEQVEHPRAVADAGRDIGEVRRQQSAPLHGHEG